MPGVLATPIASRPKVKRTRVSHYRSAKASAFPARVVLTAYLVLTPERPGFVVSVAPRVVRRVGPVRADIAIPRNLAPATGAPGLHAFAVRVRCRTSDDAFSSIASRLTFVTTRTSLLSRRDGAHIRRFVFLKKGNIFRFRA
jgi:hypothetical protein